MSPLFQYRRWVYLALLIILALDAAVIFGWIRNPDLVADADPALVENLEQETALLRDEAARLERIRDSVPLMGTNAETFKGQWFLRDTDGYRRVAEDLNGAARDARVTLTRLTGEEHPEPDQPGLKRVEVKSSVEGDYSGLLRFMDVLERLPRLYLLTELKLVESDAGEIRVQVFLITYFRNSQS